MKIKDLKGQKFGALTPTVRQGTTAYGKIIWLCICDCGNKTKANSNHLLSGARVSCGCRKLNKQQYHLKIEDICTTYVFKQYQKSAKMKNREFNLSKNDIKDFIFNKCYYCDSLPYNIFNSGRKKYHSTFEITCKYNGIDRLDSSIGYIKNNCVTCCKYCNIMKNNLSVEDFLKNIEKVYKNMLDKQQQKELKSKK